MVIGVPRAAIRKVVAGDVEVGRDGAEESGGGLGGFLLEEDEAIAKTIEILEATDLFSFGLLS